MKMTLPMNSLNIDGPLFTVPSKQSEFAIWDDYNEAIPGPQGSAFIRRSLSALTTPALTGKCLGVESFRNQAGLDMVFAGDATKLYRAFSTATATFTFSSIGGAAYNTAAGEVWEFAEFTRPSGTLQQRIIATNFSDHVQSLPIRGSTTMTFSDMIVGTKPKARHVGIIGQFCVLGNIDVAVSSTADYAPSRVWWSAFGDPTSFAPSPATQCDFEDLQSGGAVQKIIGGNEYGLVFQQEQVQVMRYTGGTTIFDFAPVAYAPGTPIPTSVLYYGGSVYYISSSGFEELKGLEIRHIGANIIDRFFWSSVEQSRLHEVTVSVDAFNKMIVWAFPTTTLGYATNALGYKLDDGRWTRWKTNLAVEALGRIRKGLSTEKFVAFDIAHKLGTFTGTMTTAQFTTKCIQPVPGRRWQCNRVRPLMDNKSVAGTATATIQVATMDHPYTVPSYSTATSLSASENSWALRTAGRFQRFLMTFTTAESDPLNTEIAGIEIEYEVLGER